MAEHAGISIGMAKEGLPVLAPRFWAEADLCVAAGTQQEQVGPWIEVGGARADRARMTPLGGVQR
jgi:hypothetical protein